MIVRVSHDKENPYVVINKHSANNKSLSFKALGIHTYLMSKPDDWRANEAELAKAHDEGLAAIRSGVQELIEHGYISRTRTIDPQTKRVTGWEWIVYETPEANPNYKPDSGIQTMEPDCDFRNLENEEEKPDCDFPLLENPRVENRTLISNELLSNKNIAATQPSLIAQDVEPAEKRKRKPVVPVGQKKESEAYVHPTTGVTTQAIFDAWKAALDHAEPEAVISYGKEMKAAKQLAQAGKRPNEITTCFWKMKRENKFYKTSHLSLTTIATNIAAVMTNGKVSIPTNVSGNIDTPRKRMKEL